MSILFSYMSSYFRFVVQPLPYSRSLLYPLLVKDSMFLKWYQTHMKFDETYLQTRSSPNLSYCYYYRYQTQPVLRDLHIRPVIDTITCKMTVLHNKRVYDESIVHNVRYLPGVSGKLGEPSGMDYVIQTEHAITLDGNNINYMDVDKHLIAKLHV